MYERTKNATESGRFFATNKWAYEDKNFKSLADSLNECDKKRYIDILHAFSKLRHKQLQCTIFYNKATPFRFMIQCQDLNWSEYFDTFIKGIHRYLLKDESFATSSTKKMHTR
jgi:hypothetical protein